jgi:hypothetical protein
MRWICFALLCFALLWSQLCPSVVSVPFERAYVIYLFCLDRCCCCLLLLLGPLVHTCGGIDGGLRLDILISFWLIVLCDGVLLVLVVVR